MTTARHSDTENSPDHLQRKLSNRHLQLDCNWRCNWNQLTILWAQVKTISLAGRFNSLYLYDYWRNVLFFLMRAMVNYSLQICITNLLLIWLMT